jgi:hypothetical protein
MTDCCASSGTTPRKHRCPVCAEESLAVSVTTILQHIKTPWQWHAKEQGYYFCSNPGCSVVYFAEDDSFINLSELRTIVGIKAKTKDAPSHWKHSNQSLLFTRFFQLSLKLHYSAEASITSTYLSLLINFQASS